MQIVSKKVGDIQPYEKNPRNNDNAVKYVEASIAEFGFKVPIVIDSDGVIVAGHTRYKAALNLGYEEVPCVVADDLNKEQVKAFRLADNKVAEFAEWDFELLNEELDELFELDMSDFGFEDGEEIDWASVEDLNENTYEEPKKDMLKCPNCQHVDSKNHFMKVNE